MRVSRDLARAHADNLAANAAQLRQSAPGGEAPAVDDNPAPRAEPLAVHAEAQIDPLRGAGGSASARIAARGSTWPSPAKEKALTEAPGEVRLQRRDARLVDALMAGRARREALDLADVARRRNDQRALANDAGTRAAHQSMRLPKLDHARGRALALAEGREHAARQPGSVAAELDRRSTSVTSRRARRGSAPSRGRRRPPPRRSRASPHSAAFT